MSCSNLFAQQNSISFLLLESETKSPVVNAHAFLASSTYGSITNSDGFCEITLPNDADGQLIITHINYETLIFEQHEFQVQKQLDTIYISKNGINLSDITVTAKRDKKWRQNLKKFRATLLGESDEAKLAKILNPEVLRFEESKVGLKATAVDAIEIRNEFLGYNISFYLDELVLKKDNSKYYKGHAKFTNFPMLELTKRMIKNRSVVFNRSARHFFLALINDDKLATKYKFRMAKYENGSFNTLMVPEAEKLLQWHDESDNYRLYFSDFLEVENLSHKQIDYTETRINTAGLESARFNTDATSKMEISSPTVSQIFKVSPYLEVSKNGNVLNINNLKEYGFWATQRMAHTLPLDYEYQSKNQERKQLANTAERKSEKVAEGYSWKRLHPLFFNNKEEKEKVFESLRADWQEEDIPPLLDILLMTQEDLLAEQITTLLQEKIGKHQIPNYFDGIRWLWTQDQKYAQDYFEFKAELFKHIDPKFKNYFLKRENLANIRLDEIVWGGVKQDGIPPLVLPKLITAEKADYLDENDVVFGVSIDGQARAYPKRILGWHEMVNDTLAKKSIAGVYCTLCGTMIVYNQSNNGTHHKLGTSGFLYRSNKLMYDEATQSLWSTIEGKPVLGPLINKNIELDLFPVVTTTWGAWSQLHPTTTVLDLNTGHQRNYDEGEAYRQYFSSDELMFPVPLKDNRLNNKTEIIGLPPENDSSTPLAIDLLFLSRNNIFQFENDDKNYVCIATESGTRIYEAEELKFKKYKSSKLEDKSQNEWKITEDFLLNEYGRKLERIKTHQSFWFAWLNNYPATRLIN